MRQWRSNYDKFLDEVTCSYIKEFSPEEGSDLLIREPDFQDSGIEEEIDLFMVNLDERYIQAIGVYLDPFPARVLNVPELGKAVRNLGSGWQYELGAASESRSSLRDVGAVEGNVYFETEDEWKFSSDLFHDMSDEFFGYNPLERYSLIDPEGCTNI